VGKKERNKERKKCVGRARELIRNPLEAVKRDKMVPP
jgi:hypothetical protein